MTEEAIPHLRTAIKINPNYAAAHYNLGTALFAEGKNEESIGYFKEAIRIRPGYAAAQKNLDKVLLQLEELEQNSFCVNSQSSPNGLPAPANIK